MVELANYFALRDDLEIHLILFGKNPTVFFPLEPKVNSYIPDSSFKKNIRFFGIVKRMGFIRRTIKEVKPDTILSFGTLWNRFVILSLLGTKYSIFISNRGNPANRLSYFQELLGKFLYQRATGIIAQTDTAKSTYLKKKLNRNIQVIGNPIKYIQKNPETKKENIILTVGRLISTKHHDRLIQIFSRLNAFDWKLIIVGGNALKQNNFKSLISLIESMKLNERVILTGEIGTIFEYYLKSKIFAFTSSSEGFPNVVGEALSAGLPVVSYDCVAGPSEMVTDGENGFLVPVFDDELFQKRLQSLIDDERLWKSMSEKAPGSIEKFSIEKIGRQYLDFILS
ncbi:MAG: glycosyltransferase [Candidatus Delongbacteria bacterium]|nr:glycosyltransferase [Candidatus Delongbacteria bacterium]